ncbi:polymeric immunoglobulin receptor isoform X3 [Oreochromis niloticus]|uniref:Polymeric immunoglobulin receptor n=1 Tax=Oreochromis niloticus TaxID=8128 RepID=A0A669DAH4_ORENI|nr:polymeric immunoglobulin receptor isoform X3 [Oreochromis niloticus]XP_025763745.1 polymeric immunoglobulin receptor isoform X3 [Oreochromis niloticus]
MEESAIPSVLIVQLCTSLLIALQDHSVCIILSNLTFQSAKAKMWSLQNLLFILCIALRCVTSAVGVIHVTGYVGGEVNVSCSYNEGYESYEKYLCKNGCGSDDVLITTSNSVKNKYRIHDDKTARIFTTTISDLQSVDAGKYWCGVSKNWNDIYTEVDLKLVSDSCCDTVTKVQSYEGHSESVSCQYESQYQNSLKYICRGNRPSTCLQQALITSDTKQNGRFRLDDDKVLGTFTVNINSLTHNDSGSYLCGVQRNSELDVFSAVELKVEEWCCVKSTKINGTAGHPLTLQCPYPPQYRHNSKFLCKGDHRNNCTKMAVSQRRFTLQDNATSSSFMIKITALEADDAGTYWCGTDSQWRVGNYTKIELSVFLQHTSTVTPGTTVGTRIPDAALYVVYTAPVALLLMCVLVIVYKYRCLKEADETTSKHKPKAKSSKEVMGATGSRIYGNQESVLTYKKQRACSHHEDPGRNEEVYANMPTTEEIYCNESFHNRKT